MVQVHKLSIHLLVRSSSVIPWDEGESVVATIPRFSLTPSARNAFYLILILLFVSFLSSLAPASHHIFLHPSQPLSATLQTFFSFSLPHFLPPAPITTLMCSFNPFSFFESLSHPPHWMLLPWTLSNKVLPLPDNFHHPSLETQIGSDYECPRPGFYTANAANSWGWTCWASGRWFVVVGDDVDLPPLSPFSKTPRIRSRVWGEKVDSVIRIDSRMERVGKWKRSKVMKKRGGEEKDYEKKEELVLKGKQGSNESYWW